MRVTNIGIRKILNSGGKPSFESEVTINDSYVGVGSSPSAIAAGNREQPASIIQDGLRYEADNSLTRILNAILTTPDITQTKLDQTLFENIDTFGSDLTLAISLAFARANAKSHNIELVQYIENETGIKSANQTPFPLVTMFSGGKVHNRKSGDTFQNVMITANTNNFLRATEIILTMHNEVGKFVKENHLFVELGHSSGFVVKNMTTEQQFDLVNRLAVRYGLQESISLAVDVAAEHLFRDGEYAFEGKMYSPCEFYNLIQHYTKKHGISFVEDPFDPNDTYNWEKLKCSSESLTIVGDDLFATQSEFINDKLANAILIKMNQAGTLTNTLETVRIAKNKGLKTCVSHRSYETEDTFMCDLAVAINSDYIKIGGPLRGDRISKYNRLSLLAMR